MFSFFRESRAFVHIRIIDNKVLCSYHQSSNVLSGGRCCLTSRSRMETLKLNFVQFMRIFISFRSPFRTFVSGVFQRNWYEVEITYKLWLLRKWVQNYIFKRWWFAHILLYWFGVVYCMKYRIREYIQALKREKFTSFSNKPH